MIAVCFCLLAYLAVSVAMARPLMTGLVEKHGASCHLESVTGPRHKWQTEDNCRAHCRKGCWRSDPTSRNLSLAAAAFGLGVLWPVVGLVFFIMRTAPKTAEETSAELAESRRLLAQQTAGLEAANRELRRVLQQDPLYLGDSK